MAAGRQRTYTAEGIRAAIRARARAAGPELGVAVNELIMLAYRDRFLSRVFTEPEWILKGGTGMLARVPAARATVDIDLARNGYPLAQSIDRLRELAGVDLDDRFRFEYRGHTAIGAPDNQPYIDGVRVVFEVYIGVRASGVIKIDLVSGAAGTEPAITARPAFRLDVPGLRTSDYRLYGNADQLADKICATVDSYRGAPSSRAKDGIDIVVFARTQRGITAHGLARAIENERRLRRLERFETLDLPVDWAVPYARLARDVPACADRPTLKGAQELVAAFVDPVLTGTVRGNWNPDALRWES